MPHPQLWQTYNFVDKEKVSDIAKQLEKELRSIDPKEFHKLSLTKIHQKILMQNLNKIESFECQQKRANYAKE